MSEKLPVNSNTADTTTWRYVGFQLPDLAAVPGPCIVDVLERTASPGNQLVRSETQYMGGGEFHGVRGEAVYWCYQRPVPAEYLTEAEASADLDVCGYFYSWKNAKETYAAQLAAGELCPADYWLKVRLHFLELGGGWLADRRPAAPIDWDKPLPLIIPALPYHEPMKVREG